MQQIQTRRERKKQAVRHGLEEASLRLFDRYGFSSTTIDQIADEADVSRSTFFRYFGSKEAVLFGAYDDGGEALAQFLLNRPRDEPALVAFENALVELSVSRGSDADREITALRRRIIESDSGLKLRRDALVHRWRFRIAETMAARAGRDRPERSHLLAAAVGIAIAERITELYVDPSTSGDAETMIRSEFSLLRDLVC